MTISNNLAERLRKIVNESNKIAIIVHKNPDGDAIGSSHGLKRALENAGKDVDVIVPNRFPSFLQWIKDSDQVIDADTDMGLATKVISEADLLFFLDFNTTARVDNIEAVILSSSAKSIMIDHHPYPSNVATETISDISASSTSELIFSFLEAIDYKQHIDKDAAESIFTGILTDTGFFSHNCSNPELYKIVASIMEYNINRDYIYDKIRCQHSYDRMRLIGYATQNKMIYLPEYQTVFISLSKEELEQFNYKDGDIEGLVNIPFSIKGVVFSVLFRESDENIRISLRSKEGFSSREFSEAHFGGGGHDRASGGASTLSLEETVEKFTKLLPDYQESLIRESNKMN